MYANHSGGKGKIYIPHFDSAVNTKKIDFIKIYPGLEEKFLNENNQWFEKKYFRKNFDEYSLQKMMC